jgi:DNA-binding beta-propeller fold protein YncE
MIAYCRQGKTVLRSYPSLYLIGVLETYPTHIAFSPDGSTVAICNHYDIDVYSTDTREISTIQGREYIKDVKIKSDGSLVVSGYPGVDTVDPITAQRTTLKLPFDIVLAPNGLYVFVPFSRSSEARLLDSSSGHILYSYPGILGGSVNFSGDSLAFCFSEDKDFDSEERDYVRVYSIDGTVRGSIDTNDIGIWSIRLNYDGYRIAFVGDGLASVFDVISGERLNSFEVNSDPCSVALSNDGSIILNYLDYLQVISLDGQSQEVFDDLKDDADYELTETMSFWEQNTDVLM